MQGVLKNGAIPQREAANAMDRLFGTPADAKYDSI
jgi:hypothetical protein